MEDFTTVIKPQSKLWEVDFRELWRYRDMYKQFVQRGFTTTYKQTVLGPLWFIITPVLSVIVYVAVFGGIAKITTDGIPPALFYLLGISVWGCFAGCLSTTSNSFVTNAGIFGKVYFPRVIMPLVAITTQLLYFLIQFVLFLVVYVYYYATGAIVGMHWNVLLFVPLMIMLALMAMGMGMIISSLTTKYRDIQMLFGKLLNLFVYVTPVIYPLSLVSNPKLHLAMSLNPVTPVMEALKYGLLGAGSFSWLWLGYSFMCTIVFCVVGLVLFNKVQKSFMDTV